MLLHRILFTTALACTSRVVQIRDHLLGRIPGPRPECKTVTASQQAIRSGRNLLDAVYVKPASGPSQAALLICHGIGEVVAQWFPIQRILAKSGIASLVFDYSGYGRSTGFPHWLQCERDAVASFEVLRRLTPETPISLLGFSLGTGVAPAILDRVAPEKLILCAGFSSFRSAARAAFIPRFFSGFVPSIWSADEVLRDCALPILVVQGGTRSPLPHADGARSRGMLWRTRRSAGSSRPHPQRALLLSRNELLATDYQLAAPSDTVGHSDP